MQALAVFDTKWETRNRLCIKAFFVRGHIFQKYDFSPQRRYHFLRELASTQSDKEMMPIDPSNHAHPRRALRPPEGSL
jgi:hypothetical protein